MRYLHSIIIVLCTLFACTIAHASDVNDAKVNWGSHEMWYGQSLSPDAKKVDVFYIVSTDVVSAHDAAGNVSMRSFLTSEDRGNMDEELKFVKDSIFRSDFNFISPYYHQYTFDSFIRYPQTIDSIRTEVGKEVCCAFDYYMQHVNNGRRYILAGFSQGGEMVMDILRHMTMEQYSRMVAAYVIGYKVTAADTAGDYATIRPAKGETDTGVTVSFNTVLNTDGIWDFVAGNAAACINPVTWTTDTTSAEFTYHGKHKVHIDKTHNVLIDDTDPTYYNKWMRETPPYSTSGINENCLHHWDLLFYTHQIHDNAIKRSK